MRARWRRGEPQIRLDAAQLTALIQPAFPGQAVVDSSPTHGGLSNTNIRLVLSTHEDPCRLRRIEHPRPSQREYIARCGRGRLGIRIQRLAVRSLYVDLSAWAEFLGRARTGEAVAADARAMIRRTLKVLDAASDGP